MICTANHPLIKLQRSALRSFHDSGARATVLEEGLRDAGYVLLARLDGTYDLATRVSVLQPDVIVYLDMTPERCHRNLLIRKRPDEVVPLEYLRVLDPRFRHAMGRLAATGSRVVHVRRDEFIPAEEILVTIDRAVKIEPRGEFLSFTDLVAQVSGRAPIVTGAT